MSHTHHGHSVGSVVTLVLSGALIGLSIGALVAGMSWLGPLSHLWSGLTTPQLLAFLLVCGNISLAISIIGLAIKTLVYRNLSKFEDATILFGLLAGASMLALLFLAQPAVLLTMLVAQAAVTILAWRHWRDYSLAGIFFYLANTMMIVIGMTWGAHFLLNLPVSTLTKVLLFATTPLLFITIPSAWLKSLELFDIICRERWQRPKHPYPVRIYGHEPFVSIHVPCYSEPPAMVIETLNKLAELNYSNYEVIVIDNNTKDPALWQPLEAHCKTLGPKFRFMHVDPLPGAKGGALNHILPLVDLRTSIVGVVDADYQAEPEFLRALVGHFDNSNIGFVQTPHDYREWRGNLFLSICYWEYKIFFHSAMIALSERNAGITVGTMCLIRKEALDKAGGWSEWCVTEDSELAIRIHDVGYSSVYVDTVYGRGLIPDTFEGYKKQRYRWTAGPVQELRHYLKVFLGVSKEPTAFTFTQRLFHLNHGLDNVIIGLGVPLQLIGIGLLGSMIYHHEIINVPFEMWLAATVMLLATPLLTLVLNKATVAPKLWEIIAQLFAAKALCHTIVRSAFRTTLTGNADWVRTNKFKTKHSYAAALYNTKDEIVAGTVMALFVVGAFIAFPYPGLTLMLLIGFSYMSLIYFCSPIMALIGVWSMRRSQDTAQQHDEDSDYIVSDTAVPLLSASGRD